jgi:hypothetical protein
MQDRWPAWRPAATSNWELRAADPRAASFMALGAKAAAAARSPHKLAALLLPALSTAQLQPAARTAERLPPRGAPASRERV